MSKCIPPDKLCTLRAKMVKCASISGHPSPEDIASQYVVRLLEGYHQKATVQQAYIDICRLSSGRKGQPGYDAKRTLNMVASEDQQKHSELQPAISQSLTIDEILDLEKVCTSIKCARTREVFMLLLEGYTQDEIADKFGLTLGRINQIVNRTIAYLAERV